MFVHQEGGLTVMWYGQVCTIEAQHAQSAVVVEVILRTNEES
jgi:hypothetical protein